MIDKSVVLPLTPAAAFELFTTRAGEWWPADRRHLNDPRSQMFMLASGRFYERATDGTELDLGRVRLWEPPHRVLLDFFVGTDATHPTQVEIRFTPEGDGTRVSVQHQPGERGAALWDKRAPIFARSWTAVLAALQTAASAKT